MGGVSIHAPRVGRDYILEYKSGIEELFQSTRPVWGATERAERARTESRVSIHAPRVGRDWAYHPPGTQRIVSIHAPRVGRDSGNREYAGDFYEFQSTRPVWGATYGSQDMDVRERFQSTRPVWGATY